MTLIESLKVRFSKGWYRWPLFALANALLAIFLAVTAYDISSLNTVLSGLEAVLITGSIYWLFFLTRKTEKLRYSDDPRFYRDRYPNEKNRMIALEFGPDGEIVGTRVGWDDSETACTHVYSLSVLEWRPTSPHSLTSLKFEMLPEDYELPWFIESFATEILIQKFNLSRKFDFNGATLSVRDYSPDGPDGQFTLSMRRSCYYSYLVTNCVPEADTIPGLPVRQMLEPGKRLNRLADSFCENHLGLSALLITGDGYVVLPVRGMNLNVARGQVASSISGAANIQTCMDTNSVSPEAWFLTELGEELPGIIAPEDLGEEWPERTRFLGMTRELRRLGKPEVFFALRLATLTSGKLLNRLPNDKSGNTPEEHKSFLLCHLNDLTTLSKKGRRQGKAEIVVNREAFFPKPRVPKPQFTVTLSESLLVNLALHMLANPLEH